MTARFNGSSEHNLDDKGRVILPSKFREKIDPTVDGESLFATQAPEKCVILYTETEWNRIDAKQRSLPRGVGNMRRFQRLFHGQAEELTCDKQGRIQLPKRLREHARMQKEVIFIGCSDRIEIWSREEWDRELAEAQQEFGHTFEAFLDGADASLGDPTLSTPDAGSPD